jgi:peroxiredoxin
MKTKLSVGKTAPDFMFDTPWKKSVKFSSVLKKGRALLVFLRYIGCPLCQMKIAELKKDFSTFKRRNIQILVFLQSDPKNVTEMFSEKDLPFTIVCDPKEKIFKRFGVLPGSFFRYVTPKVIARVIKATRRGFRHGKYEGQERQLPAVFLVEKNRKIAYAYYGKNVADVPDTALLLDEIKKA